MIGSRDAARAQETAASSAAGASPARRTRTPSRGADLAVLAVKADGALETARAVRGALGDTPLLSVASAIRFEKGVGMLPDPRRAQPRGARPASRRAPVVAGLHSIAAAKLEEAPPETRTRLSAATTPAAKELALEFAGASSSRAVRSTPARSRARARSRASRR